MKNILQTYFVLFVTVCLVIIYMYYSLSATEEELKKNMQGIFIEQSKGFTNNIDDLIHKELGGKNLYETLQKDKNLRDKLESSLYIIANNSFKYVYILYKDKYGDYRYLLDGSHNERGEFNQIFTTTNEKWDKVYKQQKSDIIEQKVVDTLWVTYLQPIVTNKKTDAIIVIDFSLVLKKELSIATQNIKSVFVYLLIAIGFLLLILIYQLAIYSKTKMDSYTDALTQTYNRLYLRKFIEKENLEKYQIIMIDIDYFKDVNDQYGHAVGDFILSKIASTINKEIRSDDVLVRYGGEEFILFTKKKSKVTKVIDIAQRIRKSIEQSCFVYDNHKIYITVSIGVTLDIKEHKTIHQAIKYADEMLYIAKETGRNKVIYDITQKSE
ncbi:GGDEF domain-containing protein [Sulfurimonas sp.]